jgi:hypothetical protein
MGNTGDDWTTAKDRCIYCGDSDFASEFGPRTFIECAGCNDLGVHVECEHAASGEELDAETIGSDNYAWYCSKVGNSIVGAGARMDLSGYSAAPRVAVRRWCMDSGLQQHVASASVAGRQA